MKGYDLLIKSYPFSVSEFNKKFPVKRGKCNFKVSSGAEKMEGCIAVTSSLGLREAMKVLLLLLLFLFFKKRMKYDLFFF